MRETLSESDIFNETVLLSLRQRKGLDLELLKKNHNFAASHFEEKKIMISQLQHQGLITIDASNLRLTEKGLTLADAIAGEFFFT
jgi:oxygen-independent coproporphyrinogen-3 oxidase